MSIYNKIKCKFNEEEAAKCLRWIRLLPIPEGIEISDKIRAAVAAIPHDISRVSAEECHQFFVNGLVLGYLAVCLQNDAINLGTNTWKISDKPIFETNLQRERIGFFLKFARNFGVVDTYMFQTVQLHENTDMTQFIICLSQLGIEAQTRPNYTGPQGYWMNKHIENKREFTKQQLQSNNHIIGLQMGSNAGATASGVTFGSKRHIVDIH